MGGLLTLKLLERGIAGIGVLVTPVAPGSQGAEQMSRVLSGFAEAGDRPPQEWFAREKVFGRLSPPDRERFVALFGSEPDSVNVDLVTGALAVEQLPLGTRLLVVGCDQDPITPVESLRGLAPSLGGEYLHLSGMGHEPMLEPGWEHAADAVLTWLGRPDIER
jgi:hypothetical protein